MSKKNEGQARMYYSMAIAQIIFSVGEDVRAVKKQTFLNSDLNSFPARRVLHAQNSLGMTVFQSLTVEEQTEFKLIDVVIENIFPLGHMTEREFWAGMGGQDAAGELADTPIVVGPKLEIVRTPSPIVSDVAAGIDTNEA